MRVCRGEEWPGELSLPVVLKKAIDSLYKYLSFEGLNKHMDNNGR